MANCPYCGTQVEDGIQQCPNCGGSLMAQQQPTQTVDYSQYQQPVGGPQPMPQPGMGMPMPGVEQKSKMAAGLLGIFLGAFGVHNFYLGYTGKAVAQLLITLLSCFILSEISAVWGFVEGILILTGSINVDAKGVPLKD